MKVISAADIARTATFVFVFAFDVTKSQYNVSNKRPYYYYVFLVSLSTTLY